MVSRAWPGVVLAGVLFAVTACDGGRSNYVQENRELLDSVPVYPGATRTDIEDATRSEDEHVEGWTTRAVFTLTGNPSAEMILSYYRRSMSGWRIGETCCGSTVLVQAFERDSQAISVNADNAGRSYEITVDARAEK